MKKGFTIVALLLFLTSCQDAKEAFVLSSSLGKSNHLLVVIEAKDWSGKVGDNLRNFLGKLVVGLPQPETTFSVTQIAPKGFGSMMNKYRNVLFVQNDEIHWVREDLSLKNGESLKVLARIRYRQILENATLFKVEEGLYVEFDKDQTAITEGQFVAWYDNNELLGSGVIDA